MSTDTDTAAPPDEEPLRDPNPDHAPQSHIGVRHPAVVVGAPVATAGLFTAGSIFGPIGVLVILLGVGGAVVAVWWWKRRQNADSDSGGKSKRKREKRERREREPRWGGLGSLVRAMRRGRSSTRGSGLGARLRGLSFGRTSGKSSRGTGPNGGGSVGSKRSRAAQALKRARTALGRALGGSRARHKGATPKGRQRGLQGLFQRTMGRLGRRGRTAGGPNGQNGKMTKLGRVGRKIAKRARKAAGRVARTPVGRALGTVGKAVRKATRRAVGALSKARQPAPGSVAGGGAVPKGKRQRKSAGKPQRKRWSLSGWRRQRAARRWRNENARRRTDRWRKQLKPGAKPVEKWTKRQPAGDQADEETVYTGNSDDHDQAGPGGKVLPFRRPIRKNAKGNEVSNPYNGAIEALGGTITVENALSALDYVYGLPALISAMSDRLTRDGQTYVQDFPTDPRAGEMAQLVGAQMRRMHDPVEKFGVVFERVHAKELDRIRNPRRNEQAWDVKENVR